MSQTRRMSLVETIAGVAIGFVVSVAASFIVYPLFGHSFTVLSIVRGYLVRRAFNWIGGRV